MRICRQLNCAVFVGKFLIFLVILFTRVKLGNLIDCSHILVLAFLLYGTGQGSGEDSDTDKETVSNSPLCSPPYRSCWMRERERERERERGKEGGNRGREGGREGQLPFILLA